MTDTNVRFADFNLRKELIMALDKKGFESPMPVQVSILEDETFLDGDLIVQAKTGSGKTLAFALPLLNNLDNSETDTPQILVLSPTRELALQTAREFNWAGAFCGIKVASLVGGMDMERQIKALRAGANVIVGTPGRILDHIRRGTFKGETVRSVVLDEGDDMLDMGFREELEGILDTMPQTERTWLFSATMPPEILALAKRYLNAPRRISLVTDVTTHEDIIQRACIIPSRRRFEGLTNVLIWENPARALLFCGTRAETQEIADKLCDGGFRATAIHGDMSQRERNTALGALRGGRVQILVATDVAARGLDIEGVSHVIQFGLPQNLEAFVHRSGRTGRAGQAGSNLILLTARETKQFKFMLRTAKSNLKMQWMPAPDAAEIDEQSKIRFEKEIIDSALEADNYVQWSRELLKRNDHEALVAGLLEKAYGSRPGGYSIRADIQREMDWEKERGRAAAEKRERERDGSKDRFKSSEMSGGIRVTFAEGRREGWQVGPLLGLLCRCIGISRDDVGNIKLRDDGITVELSANAVQLFDARKGRLEKEKLHVAKVTPIKSGERSERTDRFARPRREYTARSSEKGAEHGERKRYTVRGTRSANEKKLDRAKRDLREQRRDEGWKHREI